MRIKKSIKAWCLALATASTTLITAVTCDPYTGYLDFFRDTGGGGDYYYDDFYYDDGYYDDGFYYDDPFFYDDCFDCF